MLFLNDFNRYDEQKRCATLGMRIFINCIDYEIAKGYLTSTFFPPIT